MASCEVLGLFTRDPPRWFAFRTSVAGAVGADTAIDMTIPGQSILLVLNAYATKSQGATPTTFFGGVFRNGSVNHQVAGESLGLDRNSGQIHRLGGLVLRNDRLTPQNAIEVMLNGVATETQTLQLFVTGLLWSNTISPDLGIRVHVV